jgi:glycosyltransferase involved in cell wall biosynthesis
MVIVTGDFVKTGGMDRANYALADYVSRQGAAVELVSHRAARELTERPNVTLRRVPKPLGSYVLGDPWLSRAGARAVREGARRGAVGLVNGGNCPVRAVNWVHYVHAAYRPELGLSAQSVRRFAYGVHARRQERLAMQRAELVLTNSAATRRVVVEELGADPGKTFVVYLGIDARAFAPEDAERRARARAELGIDGRPVVAFVGALGDRRKGLDTVFEAWRLLCRSSSWDVDLVVVGAGSELDAWRARARRAGLAERVRLLGFRADVPWILAGADALVAPTRYEPFGVGVLEAIAKSLPAIVSASAGVAELYPPELRHLLLGDPESAAELADKLTTWRSRRDEAAAAMRPFSERVRARDWDVMCAEMVALIAEHVT